MLHRGGANPTKLVLNLSQNLQTHPNAPLNYSIEKLSTHKLKYLEQYFIL